MKVILETVSGSTLHGTSVDDGLEDLDLTSIFLEDVENLVGFNQKDVFVKRTKPNGVRSEAGDVDHVFYGLKKYLLLALAGNPTILLSLFTPDKYIRSISEEGKELKNLTSGIVSAKAGPRFLGYMTQQYERLKGTRGQMNVTRPELIEKYGYDTKYAGHVARLGIQGTELLTTGKITLPMPEIDRKFIVDIRTGKYDFITILDILQHRMDDLKALIESPILNSQPNTKLVEDWMTTTYIRYWNESKPS